MTWVGLFHADSPSRAISIRLPQSASSITQAIYTILSVYKWWTYGTLPRDPGRDDLVTDDADSPRVLVVDDARDMRAAIRRVLESGGYRVDAVGTLAEARAMTPGEYDVVLVDMRLGSEEGITLIEELATADPEAASRCLLMSGSLAYAPPGVATLAKPFRPDQLLDAVRALGRAEPASAGSAGPAAGPSAPPSRPATLAPTARESAASAGSALTPLQLAGFAPGTRTGRGRRRPARRPGTGSRVRPPWLASDPRAVAGRPDGAARFGGGASQPGRYRTTRADRAVLASLAGRVGRRRLSGTRPAGSLPHLPRWISVPPLRA